MSGVITSQAFHCLDNVIGYFKSPALAAVLTSGRLVDRLLGSSRMIDASIRALFTLTANNASLDADLMRRTMRVRIDSGINPAARAFDFCPINEALRDRLVIAEAACTIWCAYFNAGAPRIAADDAGGFTDWSNLCRQAVLWLQREGMGSVWGWGELGDPAASMLADASACDPELETHADLLHSLWALTDGNPFSAADLLKWWRVGAGDDEGPAGQLRGAVGEMLGVRTGSEPSTRSLGRALLNRRDRVVRGLALRERGRSSNCALWRVVRAV
ncbi:MAG: hypothetical protein AB3X44_20500 [Leptothrix sp. (in: b-proteobacteria)]